MSRRWESPDAEGLFACEQRLPVVRVKSHDPSSLQSSVTS